MLMQSSSLATDSRCPQPRVPCFSPLQLLFCHLTSHYITTQGLCSNDLAINHKLHFWLPAPLRTTCSIEIRSKATPHPLDIHLKLSHTKQAFFVCPKHNLYLCFIYCKPCLPMRVSALPRDTCIGLIDGRRSGSIRSSSLIAYAADCCT